MLHCEDALEEDENEDEDATREWAPGRPGASIIGPAYHHLDAEETLSNEVNKEEELGPFTACPLPAEYRQVLVPWMREVCNARALSPATFFAAVSLLDRFLRASGEGATPPSLLQLVALTCVAVAAKLEQQQCASELLSLARDENGNLYKADDSRMMEIHLLDMLGWRLRTPTIYTFTSLFLHRVVNRPQDGQVVPPGTEAHFRELVLRLAELAVLDSELTSVSYSSLAVACILVAETEIKGGQMHASLKTVESLRTVPGLRDLSNLSAPVQRLYCLYKSLTSSSR
ncbi:D type cyclin [Volvox carteri f. nagariensis]|uniref:D type cyclin n=1 Tax=Volvox carteri f. nagariensis TaxID=3068 RepID=D8U9L0_VOLCA|nr:D type cyclin [Volvox carteri f. nagariensis]EFJ43663.1 D type cyclin [Volvox carteri f. nagariensis]|eukprot:XP_002955363.1 D type cyclin [Volvox carteri f. nagariensis]